MSDKPPQRCEICGAKPVQRMLFAPAVVFKGSGFYSTDYGRRKKRDGVKDTDSGSGEGTAKKDEKSTPSETKPSTKSAD
jgi:predicted nucleic acid-binding Zn ribbon protein